MSLFRERSTGDLNAEEAGKNHSSSHNRSSLKLQSRKIYYSAVVRRESRVQMKNSSEQEQLAAIFHTDESAGQT